MKTVIVLICIGLTLRGINTQDSGAAQASIAQVSAEVLDIKGSLPEELSLPYRPIWPLPPLCPPIEDPVCGTNNQTYKNRCLCLI